MPPPLRPPSPTAPISLIITLPLITVTFCSPETLIPHQCPPFSPSSPPPFPFSTSSGLGHPSFNLHYSFPHSLISINNLSFSLLHFQPASSSLLLSPNPTTTNHHCFSSTAGMLPSHPVNLSGTPLINSRSPLSFALVPSLFLNPPHRRLLFRHQNEQKLTYAIAVFSSAIAVFSFAHIT